MVNGSIFAIVAWLLIVTIGTLKNTLSHFSNQTMFADIALADSSEKLSANQNNVKTFVKKEVQMYACYSEFKVTETLQEEHG